MRPRPTYPPTSSKSASSTWCARAGLFTPRGRPCHHPAFKLLRACRPDHTKQAQNTTPSRTVRDVSLQPDVRKRTHTRALAHQSRAQHVAAAERDAERCNTTHPRAVQGMSLQPSVTELMMAELLYLEYDDKTKPIYMYINSTGVAVRACHLQCSVRVRCAQDQGARCTMSWCTDQSIRQVHCAAQLRRPAARQPGERGGWRAEGRGEARLGAGGVCDL